MSRFHSLMVGLSLFGGICVGFSILRAGDEPAAITAVDRMDQLQRRIEKLEERIKTLEADHERVTRQANGVSVPLLPRPQYVPLPPEELGSPPPVEAARPRPRIFLLNGPR